MAGKLLHRLLNRKRINNMIKKEINEIKSLFDTIQDCGITRLAGCYVDGEKVKVKTFSGPFYNLPEEEMHKYLEIFRKTLSGTPGKNLLDMEFKNPENETEYGRSMLISLKKSELKDDSLLEQFYDKVIETYEYTGNYLILLIHQAYDVPGVTTDGIEMEDASDEVYSYILCSICPMKLTKPGLGFDDALGEIHTLPQIFAVELPDDGFLFPAFNDRSSDDNALLYSSKRSDMLQDSFLENVLDVTTALPPKQQKEGFTEFVSEVLGDERNFETVLSIQENLKDTVQNKKTENAGETIFFDKDTVRNVFEKSGVSREKLGTFDKKFDERFESEGVTERKLFAENVAPVRNFEVRNKNMVLRVSSKHTDIIDTRVIDGKKCLVIELTDDLTVNGIPVEG